MEISLTIIPTIKTENHNMLAIFKIAITSSNDEGTEGNAKFPQYNSQTQEHKMMPIKFKCVSKVAAALIQSGVFEGVATGRLTTESYASPSGTKRNRTVFVIEKLNVLEVQPQPQRAQSAELEALSSELAALKSQLAASKESKTTKTKAKAKNASKVVEATALSLSSNSDDIPF